MKKSLSVMLALVLVCTMLVGCSGSGQGKDTSGDKSKTYKVALVVNQKFGDHGPMDNLAAGADKAAEEFGVQIKQLESSATTFEDDIRAMADGGYDLIITTFGYMTDATIKVAKEYPDVKFAAVYQTINSDSVSYDNIWDTEFHGEQAFYLAGYMAGLLTETNRVGMQVGAEEPTPNAEGNGFMLGVLAANPNATVDFSFVNSYEDPAKAKEIAKAMVAKGCDFIQNDSGASNAGVVEAAQEAGILTSGEISDYFNTYDGFVGIVGIGFGNVAYDAIKDLVNGEFKGGQHSILGLKEGGYYMDWDSYQRFADKNSKYGPKFSSILTKAKDMEKQIDEGTVTVPFNTDTPNWASISGK